MKNLISTRSFLALLALLLMLLAGSGGAFAQSKDNDRGRDRDRDSSSTRGNSRLDRDRNNNRDNDRNSRTDRNTRTTREASGSDNKAPATAAGSAGIAQQGQAPAGAAGRGVNRRSRSTAITGAAASGIASRAPSTTVVFDYDVPIGQVVLYFDPGDLILVEGETGKTALKCHNPQGFTCDRLHLGLRYNPAAMRLIGLDPKPLQPFFRRPPKIRFNGDEGVVLIEVLFDNPVVLGSSPLIEFEWKAVAPAPFSQVEIISFRASEGAGDRPEASGLYTGARNILGAKRIRTDGIVPLGAEILVDASKRIEASRAGSLDEEIRLMRDPVLFGRGARGGVRLELEADQQTLAIGEEADIRVMFRNPRQSDLDAVRLALEFDPKVLEIVDVDETNSITTGVNLREGNRLQFPFDYFIENRADNRRGRIDYHMGLGGEAVFPANGVIATIRVKGVGRGVSDLAFRPQTERKRGTAVSFIGKDVLGTEEFLDDGFEGLSLSVR